MVWQDVFPNVGPKLDAEHERELRLVEQARAGAAWALTALIARYQPPVTRYLTRLTGSATRARPLAEHVFIRMERRLRGSQGGRQLRLWLLRACTEAGLEMLRGPQEAKGQRLVEASRPMGLLPGGSTPAANFLRVSLGKLATVTGSTSRQVRKLIWSNVSESETRQPRVNGHNDHMRAGNPENDATDGDWQSEEDGSEIQDPRDALRHRMVRAVLAELPYGDAQCLALHLVAGLNQAEVALALGITASATRRRIVHGLTLFAQRYDAAAASLGLPLDFFDTQAKSPVEDNARFDGTDRPMPMVEALTDDLEVDPLTTNEHIAVQPFAHDAAALIWSGRIHHEMATETADAAMNAPAEIEPLVVETSLAHVGEPVEVPQPVVALPPLPDVPLTVRDLWVHAEVLVPGDSNFTPSSPLTLEAINLPVRTLEGELSWPSDAEARPASVMNDTSEGTPRLDLDNESGNGAAVPALVDVRMVPTLTEAAVLNAAQKEAMSAAYGREHRDTAEGESVSIRAVPVELGRGTRVVPVLTTVPPPLDATPVTLMGRGEARFVPVLTSSLSRDQLTQAHELPHEEGTDTRKNTATAVQAADAVHATEQPQVALAGRGRTAGETNSEML